MSVCSCVQNIVQPKTVVSICYTPKIHFQTVLGLHFKELILILTPLCENDVAGLVSGKTQLEDDFFLPLKLWVEIWVHILTLLTIFCSWPKQNRLGL